MAEVKLVPFGTSDGEQPWDLSVAEQAHDLGKLVYANPWLTGTHHEKGFGYFGSGDPRAGIAALSRLRAQRSYLVRAQLGGSELPNWQTVGAARSVALQKMVCDVRDDSIEGTALDYWIGERFIAEPLLPHRIAQELIGTQQRLGETAFALISYNWGLEPELEAPIGFTTTMGRWGEIADWRTADGIDPYNIIPTFGSSGKENSSELWFVVNNG